MTVARLALGEHRAGGDVQGGKQSGGAVADVIMSNTLDVPQAHRQHRWGTVQGLNLALFIDAEHQSVIRRVQVEADDVTHLLDKERIGGELKTAGSVGLHAKGLKDAVHRGTR